MSISHLSAGMRLPVKTVTAKNFAFESDNRIHADDVAAEFGFRGGLVPGVGVYAYMTQPVVDALGRAWLERGRISARFVKPVYHGERVTVHAAVQQETPPVIGLEVKNAEGVVCGVGTAELAVAPPEPPDPADYPERPMPPPAGRLPARSDAFVPGKTILGSFAFEAHWQTAVEGPEPFIDAVCDSLAIYRGDAAACHPALIVAMANYLLRENVDLGPWIHTASDVQHFALPTEGERLTLRAHVASAYRKREHEFVELDLAMFDAGDKPLAQIHHVAIIRLAKRMD